MRTNLAGNKYLRFTLILLVLVASVFGYRHLQGGKDGREAPKPRAVGAATARIGSLNVYFQAIGTVVPPNTVTVKSRVDGELMALHFVEGQLIREGELLAEIDPRPYKVQLEQARGALTTAEALLKQALLELERYRRLIREHSVSEQQLEAQEGEVGRQKGAVISDRAAVAEAELMLTYCRITAPISGRVGLRKVDPGNMIRASDSAGIVVITQIQPMNVIFTLVESQIGEVLQALRADDPLRVEARGQDNSALIESGTLLTIDNQIDTSTGTVKAKAVFANQEGRLFPNQFVNTRLLVKTLRDALIIPSSAVQRNNEGFFVYAVEEGKAKLRTIRCGYSEGAQTVVEEGLKAGDVVVTDGVDRLRDGLPVSFSLTDEQAPNPAAEQENKS
ncbi:MAG: MdtA/MuxA family multidrug efflux RND transporter periplasmic adaptor subunit [Desulfovibrio sp.]|jgi:multidrug efflux system membrane fusion protein|nr:MdtA/MuxA family multidrug efflux RND transporter periplasmic adaptor subunit [Desulfovibrio sp.]